jgi:hypothetical protein
MVSPGGSGTQLFSDIFNLDNVIQNTGLQVGRNMLIDILREIFARDTEWRYRKDIFGYPKTPSLLGLEETAGLDDDESTRIFIGSTYRYDIAYLPAITIRPTNIAYKPVSFNQNQGSVSYGRQLVTDGYGVETFVKVPLAFVNAGAWDQTFEVKISSYSPEDTFAITDAVLQSLQGTFRNNLQDNGLFIKRISGGGETTENINQNDPIFHSTLSVETYSNWRREIPIANMVDRVLFCMDIDAASGDPPSTGLSVKHLLS